MQITPTGTRLSADTDFFRCPMKTHNLSPNSPYTYFASHNIMLPSRKAPFLSGSEDFAISHETCGAIMVISKESKDIHRVNRLPYR